MDHGSWSNSASRVPVWGPFTQSSTESEHHAERSLDSECVDNAVRLVDKLFADSESLQLNRRNPAPEQGALSPWFATERAAGRIAVDHDLPRVDHGGAEGRADLDNLTVPLCWYSRGPAR